ncbi:hypothetical protein G7Y79_00047g082830 [Physcia stellaris]|nr:hypothetical protein G7Y79_00047g082830 [Physcia stellaris]
MTPARLPPELVKTILNDLSREDLFSARFLCKGFAAVAAERLFAAIPLWINLKSLNAITGLSQSPHLRGYVQHIVFSTLRFFEHEDEAAYLARVKHELELRTDSLNTTALEYGKHMAAYHASLKAQQYLAEENRDLKVLIRALRKFPNLDKITIDHRNDKIGSRQLINDFGIFNPTDLLTGHGLYTVPLLIRALAESGSYVSELKIGFEDAFESSRMPNLFTSTIGDADHRTSIGASTMYKAFCTEGNHYYAARALIKLQILDLGEFRVKDERPDLLKMARAIKTITKITPKLVNIKVDQICAHNWITSRMEPLSVEDLFETETGPYRLEIMNLNHLTIVAHQRLVDFVFRHAHTLKDAYFSFCEVEDVKWSTVLDRLKAFRFPNLESFKLDYCSDSETPNLDDPDDIQEIWVDRFLLGQTDRNPRVIPYDFT